MSVQSVFKHVGNVAGITLKNSTELYPALHKAGDAGLPMLVIDNALGRAVIALQGAHVMSFQPAGQAEMLWVSPKCMLETGKAIRGGIPLCLPWFGAGPDGKTVHGFARTMAWTLIAAEVVDGGATRLAFELEGDENACSLWPHAFVFRLDVLVGRELKLDISAQNRSTTAAPFAFVFHTYFAVADVAKARVAGLDGVNFINKTSNDARCQQSGEVALSAESVYIYQDVPEEQVLKTPERAITIASSTRDTIVWNAWDGAKNMGDLGEGNHVGYICVERCDVLDHGVTLQPGDTYQAWMSLAY